MLPSDATQHSNQLQQVKMGDRFWSTAKCATDLIKFLFEREVDDRTLVICTSNEHENVRKIVANLDHIELSNDELDHCDFSRVPDTYDKYFIYMIGSEISTGRLLLSHTPLKLKNLLTCKGKHVVTALDVCQELFPVREDYSEFDYLVYTGHSFFMYYDLGMLLSKEDLGIGADVQALDKFLAMKRKFLNENAQQLLTFNVRMQQKFAPWLAKHGYRSVSQLPFMFSMRIDAHLLPIGETEYDILDQYGVRIEGLNSIQEQEKKYGHSSLFLRIRAQHYLVHPEHLELGLQAAHKILTLGYTKYLVENTTFS